MRRLVLVTLVSRLLVERWAHLQPRVEQKTEQDAFFQIYPTGGPSSTIDSELRPVHSHSSQRGFPFVRKGFSLRCQARPYCACANISYRPALSPLT